MSDGRPELFDNRNGILIPQRGVEHRNDEYDESGFEMLLQMQREHFWYRGRHAVIFKALKSVLAKRSGGKETLRAIDLGGGCGGWVEYLHTKDANIFDDLALADSSIRALTMADTVVGSFAARYQIDLLDLPWSGEWDVVFLLDVLEHIPDHEEALRQIRKTLKPGGLLFVTTPALPLFWTYNDELAHHQRRYRKTDYEKLAKSVGFKLVRADYFMFFLSPLLLLSRLFFRPSAAATAEERRQHVLRTHSIPARPVNAVLERIFSAEATTLDRIRFPWGTSILAVFERGSDS